MTSDSVSSYGSVFMQPKKGCFFPERLTLSSMDTSDKHYPFAGLKVSIQIVTLIYLHGG